MIEFVVKLMEDMHEHILEVEDVSGRIVLHITVPADKAEELHSILRKYGGVTDVATEMGGISATLTVNIGLGEVRTSPLISETCPWRDFCSLKYVEWTCEQCKAAFER